jgi:hypothetical protein
LLSALDFLPAFLCGPPCPLLFDILRLCKNELFVIETSGSTR